MIQAFRSLGHNQFEWAKWREKKSDTFKLIRVEIVKENERRWSTVLQNIITRSESTLLKTSYGYNYEPRQHLYYRGKWWEILNAQEITTAINPQALSLVKNINKQWVLEVIEVDGYDVQ